MFHAKKIPLVWVVHFELTGNWMKKIINISPNRHQTFVECRNVREISLKNSQKPTQEDVYEPRDGAWTRLVLRGKEVYSAAVCIVITLIKLSKATGECTAEQNTLMSSSSQIFVLEVKRISSSYHRRGGGQWITGHVGGNRMTVIWSGGCVTARTNPGNNFPA